jgi:hypothetical protein
MADYYLSKDVSGTVVCGCSACEDVEELEVVFSGVGTVGCQALPSTIYYYTSDPTVLNGTHTLTQTAPGSTTWILNIVGGFAYTLHNAPDCSDTGSPGTADIEIQVTCSAGFYFVTTFVSFAGGTVSPFDGVSGVPLDTAVADVNGNGIATVSIP